MSELFDARQLAPRYHVTAQTLLAWARRGVIPCVRAGQRPVLFDPVAVDLALRSHGTAGASSVAGSFAAGCR
jgi:hypothetical protein